MPSATVLKQLEDDMTKIAKKHKATEIRIASQYDFVSSFGPGAEAGVCHGLTMMYLAYFRLGTNGSFFDDINKQNLANKDRHAPYIKYIAKVQQQQKNILDDDDSEGEKRQNTMMTGFGMAFKGKSLYGGKSGKGHGGLGSHVSKTPYYYLLKVPGHRMAAYPEKKSYRFYDPNMGEVTFGSSKNLGGFLVDYFKSEIMMRAYSKGKKTLSVTVYRYTG